MIGRDFSSEVLEWTAGLDTEVLLDALDEACASGLVEQLRQPPSAYRFGHAIVREALYAELNTTRRVLYHREVGEALEELGAGERSERLGELAYHFGEAAAGGDIDKAVRYAREAGDAAMASLAWEEGVVNYERALGALDLMAERDDRERCELLVRLGQAHNSVEAHGVAARTLKLAIELARETDAPDLFAEAVLALGDHPSEVVYGGVGVQLRELTEEALAKLAVEPSTERVRLLGRLATLAIYDLKPERLRHYAHEAAEVAEALGDQSALARGAYLRGQALYQRNLPEEALAPLREMLSISRQAGDRTLEYEAHTAMATVFAQLGLVDEYREQTSAAQQLAAELRLPDHGAWAFALPAVLATIEGDFARARILCDRAAERGAAWDRTRLTRLFMCADLGLWEECNEMYRSQPQAWRETVGGRTVRAWADVLQRKEEDSRRAFGVLASEGFPFPEDSVLPNALTLAPGLRRAPRARSCERPLRPPLARRAPERGLEHVLLVRLDRATARTAGQPHGTLGPRPTTLRGRSDSE